LTDDGTSATTAALAPVAPELVAAELVAPADEVADDEEDDDELLPHPTAAAAHNSGNAMDSHVLDVRIAILLT
jgi:hypothetical protein